MAMMTNHEVSIICACANNNCYVNVGVAARVSAKPHAACTETGNLQSGSREMDEHKEKVPLKEPYEHVTFKWRRSRGKAVTALLLLLLMGVLLVTIGFMAGLLAGRSDFGGDNDSSSSSSPQSQTPDWGADVTIGGKTVPVLQWLDTELQPSNIKENLR